MEDFDDEIVEDFQKSFHQLKLFNFTKFGRINPPKQEP